MNGFTHSAVTPKSITGESKLCHDGCYNYEIIQRARNVVFPPLFGKTVNVNHIGL